MHYGNIKDDPESGDHNNSGQPQVSQRRKYVLLKILVAVSLLSLVAGVLYYVLKPEESNRFCDFNYSSPEARFPNNLLNEHDVFWIDPSAQVSDGETLPDPSVAVAGTSPYFWEFHHLNNGNLLNLLKCESNVIDIAFYGDSITRVWSHAAIDTYLEEFHNKLVMGVSWDKTQNLLFRLNDGEFPTRLTATLQNGGKIKFKHIVLHIGTNNLSEGYDSSDVILGIEAVIEQFFVLARENNIVIENFHILPLNPRTEEFYEKITEVNTYLLEKYQKPVDDVAKTSSKIDVIACGWDVFGVPVSLNETIIVANQTLLPDTVHPSVEGYAAWTRCIASELNLLD